MKLCTQCGETKALDQFSKRKDSPCGVRVHCKVCVAEKSRRWRAANRERARLSSRRWKENNPERRAAVDREWRQRNPDLVAEYYRRAEARRDKDHRREVKRRWKLANSERIAAYKRKFERMRSRDRSMLGGYAAAYVGRVIKYLLQQPCEYCGGQADTIDHVVPMVRGGLHIPANFAAACRSCNSSKNSHLLHEWGAV